MGRPRRREPEVRAAGGVVWRPGKKGPKVLLVHRPRYDDWSLPKGKAERDEDDETCALREVEEETGLDVELGAQLVSIEYRDGRGRWKRVAYYEMPYRAGDFVANDEVDAVRWLSVRKARAALTYERDAEVLDAFADART